MTDRYAFSPTSPHATPKDVQSECLSVLESFWANPDDPKHQGLGVGFADAEAKLGKYLKCAVAVPCGGGKTDIAVRTIFDHPKGSNVRALILTNVGAGVKQCADLLREHTNMPRAKVKDFSEETPKNTSAFAYVDEGVIIVSTYQTICKDGDASITKTLRETPFDVVVFDECHSLVSIDKSPESEAQCATWRGHVSALRDAIARKRTADDADEDGAQPLRVLSLTGTLARTLSQAQEKKCVQVFGSEGASSEVRSSLFSAAFGVDIGPQVFRVAWKDMEARGQIARLHFAHVDCGPRDPLFAAAGEFAARTKRKGIAQHLQTWGPHVCPAKFRALDLIVATHKAAGHMGIVFVQHIEVLRAVYRHLNESGATKRWVVIRGNAQNDQEHVWKTLENVFVSDEDRHSIVCAFNQPDASARYDGIIATSVCNGAMDVHNPAFCYAVQFERDGGAPACAQSAGRVARPHPDAGKVKHSFVYDLVGQGPNEMVAFQERNAVLVRDEEYEFAKLALADLESKVRDAGLETPPAPSTSDALALLVRNLAIMHSGKVRAALVGAAKANHKRAREDAAERNKVDTVRAQVAKGTGGALFADRRIRQRKTATAQNKLQVATTRVASATLATLSGDQARSLLDLATSGLDSAPPVADVLGAMRAVLSPPWPPPEVGDADAARALLPADETEEDGGEGGMWSTCGNRIPVAPKKKAKAAQ